MWTALVQCYLGMLTPSTPPNDKYGHQSVRVKAEELSVPPASVRRKMLDDYYRVTMPNVPEREPEAKPTKRETKDVVITRPPNAERLTLLRELTDKLQGLELEHLRFIDHLLTPYWPLFSGSFR